MSTRRTVDENAVAQTLTAHRKRFMYFASDDLSMAVDFMTVADGGLCAIEVKTGSNRRCASLNRIVKE